MEVGEIISIAILVIVIFAGWKLSSIIIRIFLPILNLFITLIILFEVLSRIDLDIEILSKASFIIKSVDIYTFLRNSVIDSILLLLKLKK